MMSEDYFNMRKKQLIALAKNELEDNSLTEIEIKSLNNIIRMLEKYYHYEYRLRVKGRVKRYLMDCDVVDNEVYEKFVIFDESIN